MIHRMMTGVVFLFCLLLPLGSRAAGAAGDMAEIRTSVERSSLPASGKAALMDRASEAISAGVPSADVAVVVKRGLARGLDGTALEQSLDVVLKTHQKGLPVRPVLDRIQQGLAKGVPAERLSSATRQLALKLAAADVLVNSLVKNGMAAGTPAEKARTVSTVARALERAIPEAAVSAAGMGVIRHGASLSKFEAAMGSMTAMVEMGMPAAHASGLIHKAIDRGYAETDMMMMEREMSGRLRDGARMDEVMKGMDSMMKSGGMGMRSDGGAMRGTGPGMGSGSTPHTAPGAGMHQGGGGMHRR